MLDMPEDDNIIGYADNLALVIAGNEQKMMQKGNRALQKVDS